MSNLKHADLLSLSKLVDHFRGTGYVLMFSDAEFLRYFASEFGVDIGADEYRIYGNSKGKRLRRFLELADNAAAARVIRSLWEERAALLEGSHDPIAGSEQKYRALLAKLGSSGEATRAVKPEPAVRDRLRKEIMAVSSIRGQERGYAFEAFLKGLFELNGLDPRASFRNRGEQIDGSFEFGRNIYLLEAKWQARQTGAGDLHSFERKLGEKAAWVRGLYISYTGFSEDGLHAFGRGKRTICMDGADLYEMLDRDILFEAVLDAKARRAAESGQTFVRVRDLF